MLMSGVGRARGRGEAIYLSLMRETREISAYFMWRMAFIYGS